MKYLLACLFLLPSKGERDIGATNLLKKMYERYHDAWYHTLTFVQTTERYRNDSLINTSTWYDAVMFPDRFRIDFGAPENGDAVIYRGDSVFSFQKKQLKKAGHDKNDLTFLLGGMYFIPFDSVLIQMKELHYNLDRFHEDSWQGRSVYVIGADHADEKQNQLWIDKERLILVRFIKYDDNRKEEGIFEKHIQLAGGWSETACTFYINDRLIQKEFYRDCKPNADLDPRLFEPASFGQWHWYPRNK